MTINGWLLLPSLAVVLLSGLLSMAFYRPFRAAEATRAAADGEIPLDRIPQYVHNEALVLWVILLVCIANVVLGIWRPRAERFNRPRARRS